MMIRQRTVVFATPPSHARCAVITGLLPACNTIGAQPRGDAAQAASCSIDRVCMHGALLEGNLEGGDSNRVGDRLATDVLPFFTRHLEPVADSGD